MKFARMALMIVAVSALCAQAFAQGTPKAAPPPPTGRDLYQALGGDRLTQQALEALVSIAGRDPKVAPYEGIVRAWVNSSLASSHIGDDMSAYYSKTFNEKDLKELLAFFRTPTGQKYVAQLPDALQHGANLTALMMEANRKDLEDVLNKQKNQGRAKR